jgi:16S rRNA (cytidine1402-2'-O)-methyltransferase
MIRNSPYQDKSGALVSLVTTPIGNLKDITYRAIDALKEADIIACEDTRNTGLLLSQYSIQPKKLVSLYAQTELSEATQLVKLVKARKLKLCYCSDAGMPGISDPGSLLVQACYREAVPVTIIPGPTASLSALVLSGIDSADFTFLGFLPTKPGAIVKLLKDYVSRPETLILYESPKRVLDTLRVLADVFGPDREISLVRELTKIHEEVIHGTIKELLSGLDPDVKGECVLVIKGASQVKDSLTDEEITALIQQGLKEGKSLSSLAKEISDATGTKKNQVYRLGLALSQKNSRK